MFALLILTLLAQSAVAAPFTGSSIFQGIWTTSGSLPIVWDLSAVSVSDTPDGTRISGVLTGTYTGATAGSSASMAMYATRDVAPSIATQNLTVTSQLTATYTAPPLTTVSMFNYAWVTTSGGSVCTTATAANAAPTSNTCNINVDFPGWGLIPQNLRTDFSLSVRANNGGDGTVTINLGSSAIGELFVANTGVPEPATVFLLAAAGALLYCKRRLTDK